MNALITQNLSTLALAVQNKSAVGRGSSKKIDLYGIKKLRELILELAVRGKLVAQDPEDEHATKLLEKIFTEKKRLIKEEGLKTKASEHISDEDQYLSVPDTWEYCRLGNLAKFIDYRGKTPRKLQAGIRLITAKNVRFGYISLQPEEFISEDEYDAWMTRGFPKVGDILFTPEAPLGNVAIIDIQEKFALAQRAICFQLHDPSTAPFLKISLMSPAFQKELENNATGMTATGIKASKLKEIPIPIPPLAEQHRIVAKVDELMALCDQIEQQTEASLSAHTTLVENLLATLTSSANAEELKQNWQRIASHFTTLFTTEASIDQLKQTILQLAVMGKLVPQDPNDEPAAKLLERIAAEKAQLVKEGKIKKQKPLPPIAEDEKPFELPVGWEWCRLDNLTLSAEAGWSPKCDPQPREGDDWGVLKVSAVTWGVYKPEENKTLPHSLEPRPQYEVKAGDFLISRANTAELVAKAVVVPEETEKRLMMSDKIIRFQFSKKVSSHYVNLANNSVFSRNYYAEVAGGTSSSMKNVSQGQVRNLVVALPPMEEECRILVKVNQLMTLCNQIKTHLQHQQQTRLHLADALVERAIS